MIHVAAGERTMPSSRMTVTQICTRFTERTPITPALSTLPPSLSLAHPLACTLPAHSFSPRRHRKCVIIPAYFLARAPLPRVCAGSNTSTSCPAHSSRHTPASYAASVRALTLSSLSCASNSTASASSSSVSASISRPRLHPPHLYLHPLRAPHQPKSHLCRACRPSMDEEVRSCLARTQTGRTSRSDLPLLTPASLFPFLLSSFLSSSWSLHAIALPFLILARTASSTLGTLSQSRATRNFKLRADMGRAHDTITEAPYLGVRYKRVGCCAREFGGQS